MYVLLFLNDFIVISTGGLFPTDSHEYDVFRFALSQHNDVPKLVPQVDMVDTGSSFAMTYACKFCIMYLSQVCYCSQNQTSAVRTSCFHHACCSAGFLYDSAHDELMIYASETV